MNLDDYQHYIVVNGFVSQDKCGYFVNWVRRFLCLNLSEHLSNMDKVKQFVDSLLVDDRLQDWQRDQGRKAVEIYLNLYLKKVRSQQMDKDLFYSQIIEKARTNLRLKHYAYRTEQTYLAWIGRYLKYSAEREINFENSISVKEYLTDYRVQL